MQEKSDQPQPGPYKLPYYPEFSADITWEEAGGLYNITGLLFHPANMNMVWIKQTAFYKKDLAQGLMGLLAKLEAEIPVTAIPKPPGTDGRSFHSMQSKFGGESAPPAKPAKSPLSIEISTLALELDETGFHSRLAVKVLTELATAIDAGDMKQVLSRYRSLQNTLVRCALPKNMSDRGHNIIGNVKEMIDARRPVETISKKKQKQPPSIGL